MKLFIRHLMKTPWGSTKDLHTSCYDKYASSVGLKKRGFTLVELIVSMALFIIVVFITTSAFLTLVQLNKKAQTTRAAMDIVNSAIEHMARSLRMGTAYDCYSGTNFALESSIIPQDCSEGDSAILFKEPSESEPIAGYMRSVNTTTGRGSIIVRDPDFTCCEQLTNDEEVDITNLKFYVFNAATPNNNQPRVSIVVEGEAGRDPRTQTKFSVYTSVTQRAPKN